MKTTLALSLISALLTVSISAVQARVPIRDLTREPGKTIAGEIRSVIGNEFILDDGTGQIIVDGGPLWYHEIDVWESEWVTVVGVYDDYDFDAFQIIRSNGQVIHIRNPDGPPPWANGRRRRN